jgi:hypothetical protein
MVLEEEGEKEQNFFGQKKILPLKRKTLIYNH